MADKIYLRDIISKADLVKQLERNLERHSRNPQQFQQIFQNQQKIEKTFVKDIQQLNKISIEDKFSRNQNKEERKEKNPKDRKKEGKIDVRI